MKKGRPATLNKIKEIVRQGRIEIAPQDRLRKLEKLAVEFFKDIPHYDFHRCLVTDWSSLGDYPEHLATYKKRIKDKYGIRIKKEDSRILVNIFDRIKENEKGLN